MRHTLTLLTLTLLAAPTSAHTWSPPSGVSPKVPSGVSPKVPAPATASVRVNLAGFAFVPAKLTLSAGQKVTFFNRDEAPHNVVVGGVLKSKATLARGESFSMTFAQRGTFQVSCGLHPSMTLTVVVK